MIDSEIDHDLALTALDGLASAADEGVSELQALHHDVNSMREHRVSGWTWRQIMSRSSVPSPLARIARIGSRFATAGAAFRRALARSLRHEGETVTAIADLFDVSRQRVSTLIRSDPASPDAKR